MNKKKTFSAQGECIPNRQRYYELTKCTIMKNT